MASTLVTLAALVLFVRLAPRIAGAWELGRVATGVMVGAVTTLGVWAAGLPFGRCSSGGAAATGSSSRATSSGCSDSGRRSSGKWPASTIALTVLLLLAGRFGRRWWLVAAPLFVAVGAVLVLVLPWVETIGTRPPHDTPVAARIRQLAREEGVGGTPVRIEDVHGETTAANAMSTGIGPSARVFIWDTFLDGRYSAREIEVVAAHEFGHIAHRHIWKGLAWSLLLTVPGFWIVERATRRRGGLERPEVVPYALLVLALIGLVVTPLRQRRLAPVRGRGRLVGAARDPRPAAAESVFRKFTRYDLVQPNPPLWSYIWIDNHPTVVQRIAMARAYAARGAKSRCRAASRGGCGCPPGTTTSTTSPASRRAARA